MKKHNEYTSLNLSRLLMAGRGKCVALSFAVMLLGIQTCYATGPIKAANQQLRTLFENLSNPNSDVLFLYQMGAI